MNKLIGPIGAFILLLAAPGAQAGLEINYSIDGGPTVTCGPVGGANPSLVCPNVTAPPINITILGASSNSPGTTGVVSEEESAAVKLVNVDSTASHSIVINVISTDFTTPTTPPAILMLSNIGGSVTTGGAANSLSYTSCIDTGNSQTAGCPQAIQSPTVSPNVTSTGSNFSAGSTTTIGSLGSPYAIDEQISITLAALGNLNFSAQTELQQTPEPMSVALLGGVLVLTGNLMRRKRKQQTSQV